MPATKVKDRRIQKTHNLLREALASLITEKPYDSIVVKEILDRANVGRSTFYMHFRDKDDLLVSGIHDFLGSLQSPIQPHSLKWQERILWFSLPIFDYHYRHRHSGADRIGRRGRALLHEHLRKALTDLIAELVRQAFRGKRKLARKVPPDLLSEYVASTFVLVLNWWLEGGSPLAPKEINDSFRTLVLPTLAAAGE